MKTSTFDNNETTNKFNSIISFIQYHWNDGNWTAEAETVMLMSCIVFGIICLIVGSIFRF